MGFLFCPTRSSSWFSFQGLLNFQVVTDKPEPDFEDLATTPLDNAGIDTVDRRRAAGVAAEAAAATPLWP